MKGGTGTIVRNSVTAVGEINHAITPQELMSCTLTRKGGFSSSSLSVTLSPHCSTFGAYHEHMERSDHLFRLPVSTFENRNNRWNANDSRERPCFYFGRKIKLTWSMPTAPGINRGTGGLAPQVDYHLRSVGCRVPLS